MVRIIPALLILVSMTLPAEDTVQRSPAWEAAEKAYRNATSKATQDLVTALTKEQTAVTKSGNLDLALVIRSRINELNQTLTNDLMGDEPSLVGTQWTWESGYIALKENSVLETGWGVGTWRPSPSGKGQYTLEWLGFVHQVTFNLRDKTFRSRRADGNVVTGKMVTN